MVEFKLTPAEEERANTFMRQHKKCRGLFSYTFTPTGIGIGVDIKCCSCGEKRDITNYDCW